jgi:hypothetical protein
MDIPSHPRFEKMKKLSERRTFFSKEELKETRKERKRKEAERKKRMPHKNISNGRFH